MTLERRNTTAREIKYLVMPDPTDPWLLARVRWPDVFQAISAADPEWRSDPGLFDLPYDPCSTAVGPDHAKAIAAAWGAHLPSAEEGAVPGPTLIRRMPTNWSEMSPAAKQAWSIGPDTVSGRTRDRTSRRARRRQRRAMAIPALDHTDTASEELTELTKSTESTESTELTELTDAQLAEFIDLTDAQPAEVIDLTDANEATSATVEDL